MYHNFESFVTILRMSHISVIRHVHELMLYLWVVSHKTSGSLLRRLSAWPSSYYTISESLGPLLLGVVSTQISPSISVRKETYCCNLHSSSDWDKVTPMAPHWVGTFNPLQNMTEIYLMFERTQDDGCNSHVYGSLLHLSFWPMIVSRIHIVNIGHDI
jgi:hypothetical protein